MRMKMRVKQIAIRIVINVVIQQGNMILLNAYAPWYMDTLTHTYVHT